MAARLPPEAWVVALACLPEMGPGRLRAVLEGRPPEAAWHHVCTGTCVRGAVYAPGGDAAALARRWGTAGRNLDVAAIWRAHEEAGIGVAAFGSAAFPAPFADDVDPPGVVFTIGDPGVIAGARVAIVGTRSATRYGLDVAHELGSGLAAAGVGVVSGLALGIDGAAHAGALDADDGAGPPIAVVGSGLDIVYPRAHRELWRAVGRRGLLLSEAPLGTRPDRWRFPARNRLIAALADVVVVVESREAGGSMHTVNEAVRRGRTVLAVPGPVRSAASLGTNRLLGECAIPACDVSDVLIALGLSPGLTRSAVETRAAPTGADATVLTALGWQPASLDQLLLRTGLGLGPLTLALDTLAETGWVAQRGGWYEQVARQG